ncbi:hypothetical protein CCH79_00016714 [Gambusia affinis]|uniref:Uncharacterized protein n=1 Tax=Gambusia affinis TaxID=33528 RepID=A0A315UPR4_GAMAF|nr:hypothetical protein CCH79_00016714 [Gambusia affinis]
MLEETERRSASAAVHTMSVPLYAPTPIQPAHPTPFYIEDILGRTGSATISSSSSSSSSSCSTPVIPTPTLPSANSSFTSLISPYRTPIYEPTPIHPVLSHAALTATYGPVGAFGGSIYPFHQQQHRSMGEYAQALLRQDPLVSHPSPTSTTSVRSRGVTIEVIRTFKHQIQLVDCGHANDGNCPLERTERLQYTLSTFELNWPFPTVNMDGSKPGNGKMEARYWGRSLLGSGRVRPLVLLWAGLQRPNNALQRPLLLMQHMILQDPSHERTTTELQHQNTAATLQNTNFSSAAFTEIIWRVTFPQVVHQAPDIKPSTAFDICHTVREEREGMTVIMLHRRAQSGWSGLS